MLTATLTRLLGGATLDRREARDCLDTILQEDVPDVRTAALLTVLQRRGPTPAEVAGFADSLAAAAMDYPAPPGDAIDTCGTGGDGSSTFNISTTAALLAAASGATVLKHGNRAATSRSGSADLLEQLGIPIDLDPAAAARSVGSHRFAFLFARSYHPVLKKVAPVRQQIGFPTIFNLLGPLLNPARVERQVVGVYSPTLQTVVADALLLRGVRHAMVLHGAGGLDEATPLGPFDCLVVRDGSVIRELRDPAELGVARCRLEELQVASAEASRDLAMAVLQGQPGPPRDAVVINAALALEVSGVTEDWKEGAALASARLDAGDVWPWVEALKTTHPRKPS
jgi:anthranilate phosphoribosyltransferase